MVDNALECDSPTTCYQSLEVGNPQIIISDSHGLPQTGFDGYQGYDFTLEGIATIFFCYLFFAIISFVIISYV